MKKTYIIPNEKVRIVNTTNCILGLSTKQNTPAQASYQSEGGGDGDNDVKGSSLWDEEW